MRARITSVYGAYAHLSACSYPGQNPITQQLSRTHGFSGSTGSSATFPGPSWFLSSFEKRTRLGFKVSFDARIIERPKSSAETNQHPAYQLIIYPLAPPADRNDATRRLFLEPRNTEISIDTMVSGTSCSSDVLVTQRMSGAVGVAMWCGDDRVRIEMWSLAKQEH